MDLGRIVKWVVILVIAFVAWKYVSPMLKGRGSSSTTSTVSDNSCVASAERASSTWGNGLSKFVNPPYDMTAWSTFRGSVEMRVSAAENDCGCAAESCTKAKSAMNDLRSLASEMDSAIRNGSSPPSDLVQRQEAIDAQIEQAAQLVREGK